MHLDELRELLARHARPDQTTAIDGVLVAAVEQSTPSLPSMSGTVLALVAQGAKRIASGDRVYEYRAGQYLVASVDLPVTGHFIDVGPGRPALGFGLILHPSAVAELLLQAGPGDIPPAGTGAPPGLAVSDAPDELLDAVVRMLRLLDRPRDIRVLAPLIKREILWRLHHRRAGRRSSASSGSPTAASPTSPARCGGSATTTRRPSGSKTWRSCPA